MRLGNCNRHQAGFTLIEMLVALGIFLVITGAAFTLLSTSQQRYQTDSQVLTSFQEARLGLDQMVRDIDDAGFPPSSFLITGYPAQVTSWPFAWSSGAGYTTVPAGSAPCQIGTAGGGTCTTSTDQAPGDFDIIIETNPNPQDPGSQVQWIRYQLGGANGTTLMRGVVNKTSNDDPDADTSAAGVLAPFVQNVVNNSPNLQVGQFIISSSDPAVFPGGNPVPIFSYVCDTPSNPQPTLPLCINALGDNSSANIRDVLITLIVASPLPDATTGHPRLVKLSGRGRRVNPNQ
jgi:prepilin-type N-terminal cleavage/methylation domain-containing protein